MSIRNSFRQMFRTPVKTALFLLLVILSAALLTLGAVLWRVSTASIQVYETSFTTVGTVEQKQTAIRTGSMWSTNLKDYRYFIYPVYGPAVPVSALEFADAGYILPPEKRPTYFSYSPGYNTGTGGETGSYQMDYLIAELQPLADGVPSEPMTMRIVNVLYGALPKAVTTLQFMDINNPDPEKLYAGKTYVMCLGNFGYYSINGGIQGVQSDASGARIADELAIHSSWDEVTDGFYDTPRGKRWLALVEAYDHLSHCIPVTPTQSTDLLIPFHNGDAFITEGRDISEQEYASGDRVCLVEKRFAARNGLTVGSALPLSLVYADYASLGRRTGSSPSHLNARGEVYRAFENGVYTVAGIYESAVVSSYAASYSGYEMIGNEVVIPSASVRHSDADNIVLAGPMMGYNTSFQIANGDIERYMAAWDALGIQDLDIQFYDRGYTQLKAGMDTMKSMAVILFVSGIAASILNLLFFCNLLISKQTKRTAIERSLGTGKARCALSLLSGILAIAVLGAILGSLSGWLLTDWAMERAASEEAYSTHYSSWAVHTQSGGGAVSENAMLPEVRRATAGIPVLCALAVIWLTFLIASAAVYINLKGEPLHLLSGRE